ncbi:MAG TPA: glutaredoxin family protein [Deltaproteobacteria bacterium]|nr:glutaredoxin family protein [Deltaproteobacteria bacterium]
MAKKVFFIFLFIILATVFSNASAEFYTWEDESGVTHITNYPPPKTAKQVKIHNYEEERHEQPEKAVDERKPEITLFTKDECEDCDKARKFLQSENISFTEYNMDRDPDAVERRQEIDDGDEVPFAVINRNHVYGFSESVYKRAMKLFP